MTAISSVTYDPLGYVIFDSKPGYYDEERRVTQVKTLDGNVVIDDAGFSHGDKAKALTIKNPTSDQMTRVKRLLELHSSHRLFLDGRVFSGTLQSAIYTPGASAQVEMQFAVEARLDG